MIRRVDPTYPLRSTVMLTPEEYGERLKGTTQGLKSKGWKAQSRSKIFVKKPLKDYLNLKGERDVKPDTYYMPDESHSSETFIDSIASEERFKH